MATYTKTVDPNGDADYTSLAAWEAGEQNLYVDGDVAIADCKRTGATKDTTVVRVEGWTAGVMPKIIVNPAHRHEKKLADQRSDGNYIYCIETTNSNLQTGLITVAYGFLEIQHFMFIYDNIVDCHSNSYAVWTVTGTNNFTIEHSAIFAKNTGRISNGISSGTLFGITAWNVNFCIVSGIKYYPIRTGATYPSHISNNTVFGVSFYGILSIKEYATCIVKNNVSFGATTACYQEINVASASNNVSSDATAIGTPVAHNLTSYTDYFVDPANGDFTPKISAGTLTNGAIAVSVGAIPYVQSKTVDPNGGSDYLSLAAWEAGEQNALVSGEIAIADCCRKGPLKEGVNFTMLSGWTVGVIPKIIVHPNYRHDGKRIINDTGYSIEGDFSIQADNTEVIGLHVTSSGNVVHVNANNVLISKSYMHGTSLIGTYMGVNSGLNGSVLTLRNCVIDMLTEWTSTHGGGAVVFSGAIIIAENVTSIGGIHGFRVFAGIIKCSNCIAANNTTTGFSGVFDASSDNNVSFDATAPGTTVAINKTDYSTYFVDPANGDFRTRNWSTDLFGIAGADLSSEFTTDIVGAIRTVPWDIGAFKYIEVASGSIVLTSPADLTENAVLPITFQWEAYSGAVGYLLQVSESNTFSTMVINTIVYDTFYQESVLDYSTTYYWRVSAIL